MQLFTASPFTCTVQAPQLPVSQPMCVPVSPRSSRRKCTSRRRVGTSYSICSPLTSTETVRLVTGSATYFLLPPACTPGPAAATPPRLAPAGRAGGGAAAAGGGGWGSAEPWTSDGGSSEAPSPSAAAFTAVSE